MEIFKEEVKGIAGGTKNAKHEFEFDRLVLLRRDF